MTGRERGLLVAAAVLLVGVGWQYWPKAAPEAVVGVEPVAEAPVAESGAGALGALAAHPLFSPSRQAVAEAAPVEMVAPTLEIVPPAEEVAPPEPVPVLQGLVATPEPGGAYLSDGLGGASVFLRPGQAAYGLSLERVFVDRAQFMGPEGEVTLTLPEAP